MAEDKIEYSRLILKRSGISGEQPTIPTGTTLNEMIPTDLFVGEMFVNVADDLLWVRTDNQILPISLSGSTGTTTPSLMEVLAEGNITGVQDIIVSSGASIVYEYLPTGSTNSILAVDADGRTIITSVSGATGSSGTSGTSGLSGVNGTNGTSGIDGTSGSSGTSGLSGVNGTNGTSGTSGVGTDGTSGTSGINGLSNSFFNYVTKTTITTGDPGTGHIIWNNAIQSDTTAIHVSETDDNGNNIDVFFSQLQSGTTITIQDKSSHLNYQTWLIGTPIDNSTYWEIPVTLITSTYIFPNNHDVLFIVSSLPSGTSGTSGTSGINGTDGFNGTSGTSGSSGVNGITTGVFGITIDGGGSVITTGVKGYLVVPYNASIQSWSVVSDVSGSIVVDVWKRASYAIPTNNTYSIAGTEKPTLTSQQINTDLSLSTWTTDLNTGDVIAFNVDSASTLTRATIEITLNKI